MLGLGTRILRAPFKSGWARYQMFRNLGDVTRKTVEAYLDKYCSPDEFARRLSFYGDLLVCNLHGHHTWENRSFFPELEGADPRFAHGLNLLEVDHEVLDETPDRFRSRANRVVNLVRLDAPQAYREAEDLRDISEEIERYLARHLTDEKDLAVPIILQHKLRG